MHEALSASRLRTRPNWQEYFMLTAKIKSSRSTCNSQSTGADISRDNHSNIRNIAFWRWAAAAEFLTGEK